MTALPLHWHCHCCLLYRSHLSDPTSRRVGWALWFDSESRMLRQAILRLSHCMPHHLDCAQWVDLDVKRRCTSWRLRYAAILLDSAGDDSREMREELHARKAKSKIVHALRMLHIKRFLSFITRPACCNCHALLLSIYAPRNFPLEKWVIYVPCQPETLRVLRVS